LTTQAFSSWSSGSVVPGRWPRRPARGGPRHRCTSPGGSCGTLGCRQAGSPTGVPLKVPHTGRTDRDAGPAHLPLTVARGERTHVRLRLLAIDVELDHQLQEPGLSLRLGVGGDHVLERDAVGRRDPSMSRGWTDTMARILMWSARSTCGTAGRPGSPRTWRRSAACAWGAHETRQSARHATTVDLFVTWLTMLARACSGQVPMPWDSTVPAAQMATGTVLSVGQQETEGFHGAKTPSGLLSKSHTCRS
jgi:hypothetical protein